MKFLKITFSIQTLDHNLMFPLQIKSKLKAILESQRRKAVTVSKDNDDITLTINKLI